MRAAVSWAMPLLLIAEGLAAGDPFARERGQMVELIASRGVRDREVLRVMGATPRHLFVPAAIRALAYIDRPLPIGWDATISQPYIVALMTELLRPEKKCRVLEIGTGSGYQAAVLAQLSEKVYSMEIVPELAASARETLGRLGYANVTVRQGDGYKGWPEEAPFDRIILTAAPPEVPRTLIDQLSRGGRLVAPEGSGFEQELVLIEKRADGSLRRSSKAAVTFVPMRPGGK
ncbi:MAG: protein-L-isoaspartate(D-aspartate) O-methyltransferase [Acidobacteriia bacterium]|nr:protein-L-isoaspartate(D-aspartate) O-methyltransferase [Terriglobia bacterium]